MQAVTGVFASQDSARRAVEDLRAKGVPADQITLLTPGKTPVNLEQLHADTTEQPGIGKAIGAAIGAAGGATAGGLLVAAIPGVGWVAAAGMLGAAVLAAAGAGAAAGGAVENSTTEGLPEDEIFVYEDALRQGRSVVIAIVGDAVAADSYREVIRAEGAESIDAPEINGGLDCAVLNASIMRTTAKIPEKANATTGSASRLLCTRGPAAKSSTRFLLKWGETLKSCRTRIRASNWRKPTGEATNADESIISSFVTSRRPHRRRATKRLLAQVRHGES
jgi:hypothetical protein